MNYHALALRFREGFKWVIHDRTYDGLEWLGPGEKPSKEQFSVWNDEADRSENIELKKSIANMDQLEETTRVAKLHAAEAARPMEDRIHSRYKDVHAEAIEVRIKAKELEALMRLKDDADECWIEITRSQQLINDEAAEYLRQTDWYFTRQKENGKEVPEAILQNREEARLRINHGNLVYKHWQTLRAKDLPSREDIEASIRDGGELLDKMLERIRTVRLRYQKPKKVEDWR